MAIDHSRCSHESTPKARAECRKSKAEIAVVPDDPSHSGLYVIELSSGLIKVGLSQDTKKRIATHLRNARSVGGDPRRYAVIPCPLELLDLAEQVAHRAVKLMGGNPTTRTREVFRGVEYDTVLAAVRQSLEFTLSFDALLHELASGEYTTTGRRHRR